MPPRRVRVRKVIVSVTGCAPSGGGPPGRWRPSGSTPPTSPGHVRSPAPGGGAASAGPGCVRPPGGGDARRTRTALRLRSRPDPRTPLPAADPRCFAGSVTMCTTMLGVRAAPGPPDDRKTPWSAKSVRHEEAGDEPGGGAVAPARCRMRAGAALAATGRPEVSVRMKRLRPLVFSAPSWPRVSEPAVSAALNMRRTAATAPASARLPMTLPNAAPRQAAASTTLETMSVTGTCTRLPSGAWTRMPVGPSVDEEGAAAGFKGVTSGGAFDGSGRSPVLGGGISSFSEPSPARVLVFFCLEHATRPSAPDSGKAAAPPALRPAEPIPDLSVKWRKERADGNGQSSCERVGFESAP